MGNAWTNDPPTGPRPKPTPPGKGQRKQATICECGRRLDGIDLVAHGLSAEIVGPCVCEEPGSLIARAIIKLQREIFEKAAEKMAETIRAKAEGVR